MWQSRWNALAFIRASNRQYRASTPPTEPAYPVHSIFRKLSDWLDEYAFSDVGIAYRARVEFKAPTVQYTMNVTLINQAPHTDPPPPDRRPSILLIFEMGGEQQSHQEWLPPVRMQSLFLEHYSLRHNDLLNMEYSFTTS